MRFLSAFFSLIPLQAMSLQEFDAKPGPEESVFIVNFVDKMASDLAAKNPQLGAGIRDYFSRPQPGKPMSEGMERLYVELTGAGRQRGSIPDPAGIDHCLGRETLAAALELDMTAWFTPTAENYFSKIGRDGTSTLPAKPKATSRPPGASQKIQSRRHRRTPAGRNRLAAGVPAQNHLRG